MNLGRVSLASRKIFQMWLPEKSMLDWLVEAAQRTVTNLHGKQPQRTVAGCSWPDSESAHDLSPDAAYNSHEEVRQRASVFQLRIYHTTERSRSSRDDHRNDTVADLAEPTHSDSSRFAGALVSISARSY